MITPRAAAKLMSEFGLKRITMSNGDQGFTLEAADPPAQVPITAPLYDVPPSLYSESDLEPEVDSLMSPIPHRRSSGDPGRALDPYTDPDLFPNGDPVAAKRERERRMRGEINEAEKRRSR